MTTSEQIDQLAAALAKAQGELQNVVKDAKNPHFKSDYATLDAITDTVRPVFAKHGLALVQIPSFYDGACVVDNLLTHSSGQWLRGSSSAPVSKADAQGVGSATTYLRRYATAGIAALAQTDDDGNAATAGKPNGRAQSQPVQIPPPSGFEPWLLDLHAVADEGTPNLEKTWRGSKAEYRQHLTSTDPKLWESIKAKAAKATVAA